MLHYTSIQNSSMHNQAATCTSHRVNGKRAASTRRQKFRVVHIVFVCLLGGKASQVVTWVLREIRRCRTCFLRNCQFDSHRGCRD